MIPYALFEALEARIDQARFDAATDVVARIEVVLEDPSTAVKVTRRRT